MSLCGRDAALLASPTNGTRSRFAAPRKRLALTLCALLLGFVAAGCSGGSSDSVMQACQAGGESKAECTCLIPAMISLDEGKDTFLGIIALPGDSNGPPSQQALAQQFSSATSAKLADLAEYANCPTS
jgi:hypothetical protein